MTLLDFEEIAGIPISELLKKKFSLPELSPTLATIAERINGVRRGEGGGRR
jgi:hypothetical protein